LNLLHAQALKNFSSLSSYLQPSPAAAAIGAYGGTQVGQYNGSLNKSIPLFTLNYGSLTYSPALFYSTNGVKVNEWGGEFGIDWKCNATAVITREVHGIADEYANYSIKNFSFSSMNDYNSANLTRIKNLSTMDVAKYDGEFDVFRYNLFGTTGEFIIDGDSIRLLNHEAKVKIIRTNVFPLKFDIITSNGDRYKFGDTLTVETSRPDLENQCEIEANYTSYFVPTAWYVNKLISPQQDTLVFEYGTFASRFMRAFSQTTVFKYKVNEIGDDINCQEVEGQVFGTLGSDETFCAKFKYLQGVYLQKVSCGDFVVEYSHTDREDMYGQKLVSSIAILTKGNSLIRKFDLIYDKIVSSAQHENKLDLAINSDLGTWNELSTRYFLSKVRLIGDDLNQVNEYRFTYLFPQGLPHRFSFGQDYTGYANGLYNTNFIPQKEAQAYFSSVYPNNPYLSSLTEVGDRNLDTIYGGKGVLSKIMYPTGGFDTILYEPHSKMTNEWVEQTKATFYEGHTNTNTASSFFDTDTFYSAKDQAVTLRFHSDWNGPNPPTDDDGSFYFTIFNIIDQTTGEPILKKGYHPDPEVHDVFVAHLQQKYIDVLLKAGHTYYFTMEVWGYNTVGIVGNISYSSLPDTLHRFNEKLPGFRVRRTMSFDGVGNSVVDYDYRHFDFVGLNGSHILQMSDSTSTNVAPYINSFVDKFSQVMQIGCQIGPSYQPFIISSSIYHLASSDPKYDNNVFDGSYIAYSHITKILKGQNSSGFESTVTTINSNEGGGVIMGDYTPYIPMSNMGWANGLTKSTYSGSLIASIPTVRYAHENYYSIGVGQNKEYYNYAAYLKHPELALVTYSAPYYEFNFLPYTLVFYPWRSSWYKLDSTVSKYFESTNELREKYAFEYSPISGLQKSMQKSESNGTITNVYTVFPDDLNNPDANSTENNYMMTNFVMNWPVKNVQTKHLTSVTTKYDYVSQNGRPYLDRVKTWKDNHTPKTVFQAGVYTQRAKILDFINEKGETNSFVWDDISSRPIANGTGCTSSDLGYTSFETYQQGNWSGITASNSILASSVTGEKHYSGSNIALVKSGLNAGSTYTITYWSKSGAFSVSGTSSGFPKVLGSLQINGDNWLMYEHEVTGQSSVTLSGNGSIDELRLYPKNAFVKTYTYSQSGLTTSECDPAGRITHYEYNNIGSLTVVKDQNGNVLKKYEYRFATQ